MAIRNTALGAHCIKTAQPRENPVKSSKVLIKYGVDASAALFQRQTLHFLLDKHKIFTIVHILTDGTYYINENRLFGIFIIWEER